MRWALAPAAVGIALLAEKLAEDERLRTQSAGAPPLVSWLLFGLAGLALVLAAGFLPSAVPKLRPTATPPFRAMLRVIGGRRLFLVLLALATVCGVASIPLFVALNNALDPEDLAELAKHNWPANTGSWLLYIAGVVFFGLAFFVWEHALNIELRKRRSAMRTPAVGTPASESVGGPGLRSLSADRLPRNVEWALVGALCVVALALRMVNLESIPPGLWFDEAYHGVVARQLLTAGEAHPTFLPDIVQFGAFYFYLLGAVIRLFGADIWQVRILPALAGTIVVPLVYLLGARLYGWRAGLAAAGLVCVSAWHITFSRLGMVGMFTVALDMGVYVCLLQALRTGRLAYYAAGGVLLGFALQTYYISRLVPVVLLALLVHLTVSQQGRFLRTIRAGIPVFLGGALLASLPVATFAVQHPDVFNSRIAFVSIFGEGGGGWLDTLWTSLSKHLLMFNFAGDMNGRHNLPGRPMLDWLTASLFFGGLAFCLLRIWRWQYFFPLVWFVMNLSAGAFSLVLEAPQAHRTLENSVVTALIAGIFLGECWQVLSRALSPASGPGHASGGQWAMLGPGPGTGAGGQPHLTHQSAQPRPRPASGVAHPTPPSRLPVRVKTLPAAVPPATSPPAMSAVGARKQGQAPMPPAAPVQQPRLSSRRTLAVYGSVLGIGLFVWLAGSMNVYRYFQLQARDRTVWKDMYAPELQAARVVARYSGTRDVYVSPVYYDLPTIKYLAPGAPVIEWPGLQILPFNNKTDRDIMLVLAPESAADLTLFARLYPHATFEPLLAPSSSAPLAYTIYIPAADVQALHGVRATFYPEGSTTPGDDSTAPTFQYDWGSAKPPGGTIRLSATLKTDSFGDYRFEWQSGVALTHSELLVDGYEVSAGQPISLGTGLHSIVVTETVSIPSTGQRPAGISRLLWTPPNSNAGPIPADRLFDPRRVEPHGLTAFLRRGTGFTTEPVDGRVDPVISFYFQRIPLERPYTTEWVGRLYVPETGHYVLSTEQISTSRLIIDGNEILDNYQTNAVLDAPVDLTAGWHDIRLLFQDLADYSHIYLYWTPPSGVRSIIPSAFLWPRMGRYPSQPESGAFPTLDEANGSQLPPDRIVGPVKDLSPSAGRGSASLVPGQSLGPSPAGSGPEPTPTRSLPPGEPLKPGLVLGEGGSGEGAGSLNRPQAAAVDDQGNIYVLTIGDGRVYKYGPDGHELARWNVLAADGNPATEASALIFRQGRQGRLFVLDSATSELVEYTPEGQQRTRRQLCDCYFPRAMSVAADGSLWVADTGQARVLKIDAEGKVVASIEGKGDAPGQFVEPTGVWEAPDGTLFVADTGNSRVQSFTPAPELKPLAQWSMGASIARDGNRLTATPQGNVLVTQAEDHAIVMYDRQGKELRRWIYSRGGAPLVPAGIAPAGAGKYVVLFPNDGLGVLTDLSTSLNP